MRLSTEIKKKLKKAFPKFTFKVRIEHTGIDAAINIYTDALPFLDDKDNYNLWLYHTQKVEGSNINDVLESVKKWEKYKEIERQILKVVQEYQKIYRCEKSEEILAGGNTFIFVYPLNNSKF